MKINFRLTTKLIVSMLLTGLLSAVVSAKLDSRTFYNTDKSKSFDGTFTSYDQKNKKVRVVTSKGRVLKVNLSALCNECKDYITANASKVAVASSLDISFKKIKGAKNKKSSVTDYKYDIEFRNRSKTVLEGLNVEYTIYYKKDALKKRSKKQLTLNGTFNISSISPRSAITESTDVIKITRKRIKSKGGG